MRELPSRAPSCKGRWQWVHAWKAGTPSGPKSATGRCRQFWRHEWTDLAVPPRPDNRQLVLAIYVMLTLVLWPSAASHQHQWKTVLAAQSAAISRRHGLGCWAILSALWPCMPQMQHCEDIKAQALLKVGAMTLALGGLGLVVLSGMIGQQVFCQLPCSTQTLQHGLTDGQQQTLQVSGLGLILPPSIELKEIFGPLCSHSSNICPPNTTSYCNTSKHFLTQNK